jgi:phosphatidate cytidylyltransferase
MVAVILLVAAVAVDYSFFFVPATGLELYHRWNVIWHGVSGGFYLAWSFRCLRLVALESLWNIVWLLLVVWNCDTGCLLAGRCLGHKERSLLPRLPNIWLQWLNKISPNKSTIGMLGGLILGTLTAVLLYGPPSQQLMTRFFAFDNNQEESISSTTVSFGGRWHEMELWERTRVGFQLSILAILGDLMESVVKRRASKKDSGSLVPGHGGILDRFDSSLLSGIFFYHFILQPHNDDS